MVDNATDTATGSSSASAAAAAVGSESSDPLDTAKWTRFLPQTFGIQEAVRQSSYRWCVREGGMWGIATATAMSLHRLRMGSRPIVAGHTFFGTFMVVMLPSYYFCYRRREHQEEVIEAMMKYNQFGHAVDMPAEPPLEEHPFWKEGTQADVTEQTKHNREFRGMIKERKEWQKPQQEQAFEDIFQEKK